MYFVRKKNEMKSRNVDIIYFTNKINCILCIMAVNCHLPELIRVCIRCNGVFDTNLIHMFTKKMQKFEGMKNDNIV